MLDFENTSECRQSLALVFIEDQSFDSVYDVEEAFERGTAFPELYKPLRTAGASK